MITNLIKILKFSTNKFHKKITLSGIKNVNLTTFQNRNKPINGTLESEFNLSSYSIIKKIYSKTEQRLEAVFDLPMKMDEVGVLKCEQITENLLSKEDLFSFMFEAVEILKRNKEMGFTNVLEVQCTREVSCQGDFEMIHGTGREYFDESRSDMVKKKSLLRIRELFYDNVFFFEDFAIEGVFIKSMIITLTITAEKADEVANAKSGR